MLLAISDTEVTKSVLFCFCENQELSVQLQSNRHFKSHFDVKEDKSHYSLIHKTSIDFYFIFLIQLY